MEKALDAGKGVDGDMAQVIEEGEFGVLFEGAEELERLRGFVEWAIASTSNVGVPLNVLTEWQTALEEALTAPRDEEEVEEEKQRIVIREMEVLPPTVTTLRAFCDAANAHKPPVRARRREE